MTPFEFIHDEIKRQLEKMAAEQGWQASIAERTFVVEPPRDSTHGDLSSNVAMVVAKDAGVAPKLIAEKLQADLKTHAAVRDVSVAGPGFLNISLHDDYWRKQLGQILASHKTYGKSNLGGGQKVNIEFVSANPTGPMHVGHCRGAVFGDALASLLEFTGHRVTREYYINDAGAQVDMLARSAFLRYREALGEKIGEIPEGFYPGDYLKPVGEGLKEKYGASLHNMPESEWLAPVRDFAIDAMMAMIASDLEALGIGFDVFFSERTLAGQAKGANDDRIHRAIEKLREKDLIYTGTLEPPKGKLPDDWEERPQTLFRSTTFGDDVDRPLMKSDGSYTYFASDIAYHADKITRGFNILIDVLGADHGGYVKRVGAAIAALAGERISFDVKLCQLVKLFRAGEPVRMSKRSGSFVTLAEVVEEVGRDVVRFLMLTRKNEAPLDFDMAKALEQSKDNPVFYVQYAHARVHSVLRMAGELMPSLDVSLEALAKTSFEPLTDKAELELIRQLCLFPRMLEAASSAHEPHRVAFYLYDLAASFHALWNKGKDDTRLRFIVEGDENVTLARLGLIRAVASVIAAGLGILGVKPVEEMR